MLRNGSASYGWIAVVLHWTIAAAFLATLTLGFLTTVTEADPLLQFELFQWHKSAGFLTLALGALRLAMMLADRRPEPLPGQPRWANGAAGAAHWALALLAVAVALAGWAVASVTPLDIPSYVFNLVVVPPLPMTRSDAAEASWSTIHAVLAYGTAAIALVHATAAVVHHTVLHDGTLRRMLRPG